MQKLGLAVFDSLRFEAVATMQLRVKAVSTARAVVPAARLPSPVEGVCALPLEREILFSCFSLVLVSAFTRVLESAVPLLETLTVPEKGF